MHPVSGLRTSLILLALRLNWRLTLGRTRLLRCYFPFLLLFSPHPSPTRPTHACRGCANHAVVCVSRLFTTLNKKVKGCVGLTKEARC
ncbi:hypothetical protein EJ02DRAFT_128007 [Clathrospora elynae]|uniref:Secreted protein n=1 Tax=Clathrospora elynae TaxID=706981 RepID=A0A6A5SDB5_9PLEO|nr:hypothetical protein EJ02DRAFT_128007 [Clathrospora elynae]